MKVINTLLNSLAYLGTAIGGAFVGVIAGILLWTAAERFIYPLIIPPFCRAVMSGAAGDCEVLFLLGSAGILMVLGLIAGLYISVRFRWRARQGTRPVHEGEE